MSASIVLDPLFDSMKPLVHAFSVLNDKGGPALRVQQQVAFVVSASHSPDSSGLRVKLLASRFGLEFKS